MKKEIKEYRKKICKIMEENNPDTDWKQLKESLSTRIKFYQHERLIHLIVTMGFSVMFILSFLLIGQNTRFIALTILLLVLLIPYIKHYYLLENSVQLLQRYYFSVLEKIK